MNKFSNFAAMTAVVLVAASPALAAAPAVRPSVIQLPAGATARGPVAMGTRLGRPIRTENNLLGAPLFLVFLGAVAVTIGTVVIVNNSNPSSPQAG